MCFTMTIVSDGNVESSERFDLMLSSSEPGVVLGINRTTVMIVGDEGEWCMVYVHTYTVGNYIANSLNKSRTH